MLCLSCGTGRRIGKEIGEGRGGRRGRVSKSRAALQSTSACSQESSCRDLKPGRTNRQEPAASSVPPRLSRQRAQLREVGSPYRKCLGVDGVKRPLQEHALARFIDRFQPLKMVSRVREDQKRSGRRLHEALTRCLYHHTHRIKDHSMRERRVGAPQQLDAGRAAK